MDKHRTGTGTGTRMGSGRAEERHNMGTGTGPTIGLGRVEERRRSARNRTRVVDAMWEKGETWAEKGKT